MTCLNDKFIIDKGIPNEYTIQIKSDGETLPLVLDPSDTFNLKLYALEDTTNTIVAELDMTDTTLGQITIEDEVNGKIKILMKDTMTTSLINERGTKADRYYLKPTYRALITGVTSNDGNIVVPIDLIYVR